MFTFGTTLFAAQPKPKANQANTGDMWIASPVPELPTDVTHHTFRSESMKREVGYCIYLPPSYAKDTERGIMSTRHDQKAALSPRSRKIEVRAVNT